jgi:WD40 repeat protein
VAFSPIGETLASGGADTTIILWNLAAYPSPGESLTANAGHVMSVAFSPDGKILASVTPHSSGRDRIRREDKIVRLWDVQTHQPLRPSLTGHTDSVTSVAFSPRGILASGSWDNTVRLWDVQTHQQLGPPLTGHVGFVTSVAFSRDGTLLASGSWDNTVRLWDVRTHKGASLTGHKAPVLSLAFSPDGKVLASGSDDKTVRLWDVRTHRLVGAPLTGLSDSVTSVAFSPDGENLAWADAGGHIYFLNLRKARAVCRVHAVIVDECLAGLDLPQGHSFKAGGSKSSVAFSPDGQMLASGDNDGSIILWNVETGRKIGNPLIRGFVTSVAFSPAAQILVLASAEYDGTIMLWNVDPEKWAQRACHIVNLTDEERVEYMDNALHHPTCNQSPTNARPSQGRGL